MASLESIHLQDDNDGSPRFATMRPVLGALLVPGRGIKTHKLDSSFGGTGALLSDDWRTGSRRDDATAHGDRTNQVSIGGKEGRVQPRTQAQAQPGGERDHAAGLEGAIGGKLVGLDAEVGCTAG